MQPDTSIIPRSWLQFAYLLAAAIFASGATYLALIFNRKKIPSDIHKTEAEARSLDMDASIKGGDWILEVAREVAEATVRYERVNQECAHWKYQAASWKEVAEQRQAEIDLLYLQVGKEKNRQPPRTLTDSQG